MVSGFPLKHAMTSTKRHVCHVKKKKLTLGSLQWTSVVERWVSEVGARLRQDTLAQILLHLGSAAATDDFIRIGAGSPGLVGLIVSLALKMQSHLSEDYFLCPWASSHSLIYLVLQWKSLQGKGFIG